MKTAFSQQKKHRNCSLIIMYATGEITSSWDLGTRHRNPNSASPRTLHKTNQALAATSTRTANADAARWEAAAWVVVVVVVATGSMLCTPKVYVCDVVTLEFEAMVVV